MVAERTTALTLEDAVHRSRYYHDEPKPLSEGSATDRAYAERIVAAVREWMAAQPVDPIPMVLHCPACGTQHIDVATAEWPNPPHRSHLCGSCGCIWRPADVATVGVERIATVSGADSWPEIKEASERDELEPLPLQAVEPDGAPIPGYGFGEGAVAVQVAFQGGEPGTVDANGNIVSTWPGTAYLSGRIWVSIREAMHALKWGWAIDPNSVRGDLVQVSR